MEKIRYTLQELSCDLEISVKDLRKYVKKGILVATKIGRSYFVNHSDLDQFLRAHADLSKKSCKRNYMCQHYDRCLDKAARANSVFSCEGCKKFVCVDNRVRALWEPVFS